MIGLKFTFQIVSKGVVFFKGADLKSGSLIGVMERLALNKLFKSAFYTR